MDLDDVVLEERKPRTVVRCDGSSVALADENGVGPAFDRYRRKPRAEARAVDALAIGDPVDRCVMRAHQQVFVENVETIGIVVEWDRKVGTAIVKREPTVFNKQDDHTKGLFPFSENDLLTLPVHYVLCAAETCSDRRSKR